MVDVGKSPERWMPSVTSGLTEGGTKCCHVISQELGLHEKTGMHKDIPRLKKKNAFVFFLHTTLETLSSILAVMLSSQYRFLFPHCISILSHSLNSTCDNNGKRKKIMTFVKKLPKSKIFFQMDCLVWS